VLRLLRGGAAQRSIWLCWETGVLDVLLPEVAAYISDRGEDDSIFRLLVEVDERTRRHQEPLDDILLWAVLLIQPLAEVCADAEDRLAAAHDFLEPIVERLALPRRIADAVRRIFALLPRIEKGDSDRLRMNPFLPQATELSSMFRARGIELSLEDSSGPGPQKKKKRRRKKKPSFG